MINTILGIVLGLCFFIATISAYILGLKHGKQLSNGSIPTVNINPIKPIINAVEQQKQKREEKEIDKELADIFDYNIETAMEAIQKEKTN